MVSATSDEPNRPPGAKPVKIIVAGGFGVGKTTFVGAVSEIVPLTTEAVMTSVGEGVDDLSKVPDKTMTTVAMDFGRVSLERELVLYLFGTPGQTRFWFMWDYLCHGAIGAVVLVDTRRLADCFAAIDYFDDAGMPYVVAVNCFGGVLTHDVGDVRDALSVPSDIPVVTCDARDRESVKNTLIQLVQRAVAVRTTRQRQVPDAPPADRLGKEPAVRR